MKFAERYADFVPMGETRDGIFRSGNELPCVWRGEKTPFVETFYEMHFCSDECLKEFKEHFCYMHHVIFDDLD